MPILPLEEIQEINAALGRKGWSQNDLAVALDLPRATVNGALRGATTMAHTSIDAIREAVGLPIIDRPIGRQRPKPIERLPYVQRGKRNPAKQNQWTEKILESLFSADADHWDLVRRIKPREAGPPPTPALKKSSSNHV